MTLLQDAVQDKNMSKGDEDLLDYFEVALHTKSAPSLSKITGILQNMAMRSALGAEAPKKTKIKALYFRVDAAFMLLQRHHSVDNSSPQFLMADRSPQGGRDWLLSRVMTLRGRPSQLRDDALAVAQARSESEDAAPSDSELQRLQSLRDNVCFHTLPPAALGLSLTDVAHKSAALLHSLMLETDRALLQSRLMSMISVTGDLGVEIGIPSFRSPFRDLMPPWRRQLFEELVPEDGWSAGAESENASLEADGDFGEARESNASGPVANALLLQAWASHPDWRTRLMPFAMAAPGMLHVCNNLMEDMDTGMTAWDPFWEALQNVNALFAHQLRLNKFCVTCLDGVPCQAGWYQVLSQKLPKLYSKRWGCITHFLKKLQPNLRALRTFWNQHLYGADKEEHEGGHFDPAELTRTLRDPFCCRLLGHVPSAEPNCRGSSWME